MLEEFCSLGLLVRNSILRIADLLRDDWTPGAMSLLLFVIAAIYLVAIIYQGFMRIQALRWAIRVIIAAPDRKTFVSQMPDVHRTFTQVRDTRLGWLSTGIQS